MSAANPDDGEKHRGLYPPSRTVGLLPPWKPGVSPNPGGVKKGQVFVSEAYKRLLCLSVTELQAFQPANSAEAIALRQIVSSIYGQDALPSAKEITDRTEGKAQQKIELSGQINVTTDLIIAYHTQIHAMIVTSNDPEQAALQLARAFMLPAEEFAVSLAAVAEEPVSPQV